MCKCANRTRAAGQNFFGLQFFGECWSGSLSSPSNLFMRDGRSNQCIGPTFKPCSKMKLAANEKDDNEEEICVGKAFTNYIYTFKSGEFRKTY